MTNEQFKYILRNIGRKKKQTFFSILCVLISTLIILGNIALNNGIQYKLRQAINEAISGQLTMYKSNSSNINILEAQLKDQSKFIWSNNDSKNILKISDNLIINKRVRFGSLISYKNETSYVNIHALDTSHLNRLGKLIRMKQGSMPIKQKGILLSKTSADELHCIVGDTILLVANNTNDYMSDEVAIVTGIFEEVGLTSFFSYCAFMSYDLGSEIVQLNGDECLELVINTKDNSDIPNATIIQIKKYLENKREKPVLLPWNKTIPLFYSIVMVWQGSGYLTQLILISFSLVILISLTSLIVNSRKKEFGTLLAIGFSWRKITAMLCLEYLTICSFAVSLGYTVSLIAISLVPNTGIYVASKDMQSALMTDYIQPIIYTTNFLYVLLLFIITIFLSVFISVSRIKKFSPMKLINNN